jgi:putative heme-binding domain-containing protein
MRALKDVFAAAPAFVPVGTAARGEALLLLRDVNPTEAKPLFYALAKLYDGKDHFYRAAINIACGSDPERRKAILADFDKEFPEWNDKVADLVWELRPPSVLPRLGTLLADAKLTEAQRARIVDILAVNDDPAAGKMLIQLVGGDAPAAIQARAIDNLKQFLPGKWRDLRNDPALEQATARLTRTDEQRLAALGLIAAAELTNQIPCVVTHLIDEKMPAAVRREAAVTLGKLPHQDAVSALQAYVHNNGAKDPLTADAVAGLGAQLNRKGGEQSASAKLALSALQELVTDAKADDGLKKAALSSLAGTRPGTVWLLDAHAKKQLPDNLVADAGRLVRNTPYQDLRNKALMAFPPPGKLDPKKLPALAELAKHTGDAERGKAVMAASLKGEAQCMKCHMVRGVGGAIGPDLSMIGKKASRENLFESIVTPSKAVADQFINWQIENQKGQVLTGLIMEETPAFVLLRDANGKDTRIDKKDIASREKSKLSLMPEDIVKQLSEQELTDVVEYLLKLKTPALTFGSWMIAGPFEEDLEKVHPPEKGAIDWKAAYDGKSGKVGWRVVTPNGEGYVDLAAFYAPSSERIASYLYRAFESPVEQDATILVGTDDGAKLWLNGKLLVTTTSGLSAVPEREAVKVKLKPGKNELLMKIANGNNPHGFYLTIESEQELKPLEPKPGG